MTEATERADRAHRLLNDPEFKRAIENTEMAILRRFGEIPTSNVEQLRENRIYLQLLQSVVANLKQAISDGKLEIFRVEQEKTGFLQDASKLWNRRA